MTEKQREMNRLRVKSNERQFGDKKRGEEYHVKKRFCFRCKGNHKMAAKELKEHYA